MLDICAEWASLVAIASGACMFMGQDKWGRYLIQVAIFMLLADKYGGVMDVKVKKERQE